MKIYIYSAFITFISILDNFAFGQSNSPDRCITFEIQETKTVLNPALNALGKEDFLYKIYACGANSGYVIQLYMFKKLGLAITSKNGLVDKIELLDTLMLPHYDDGVNVLLTPTYQNIINLFGKPFQILESDTTINLIYRNKAISFILDYKTKKLIKATLWGQFLASQTAANKRFWASVAGQTIFQQLCAIQLWFRAGQTSLGFSS